MLWSKPFSFKLKFWTWTKLNNKKFIAGAFVRIIKKIYKWILIDMNQLFAHILFLKLFEKVRTQNIP